MIITNQDLYLKKYSVKELKLSIGNLDLQTILQTQVITLNFALKYILNPLYQVSPEEKQIDVYTVNKYQPHINLCELKNLLNK
jgi:hypothetical protein